MAEPRYRHYYGFCEADNVLVQIEVHPDAGPDATLPPPGEWEDFGLRCPVCDDTVLGGYDGADDWTTEQERDLRAVADERLRRVEEEVGHLAAILSDCRIVAADGTENRMDDVLDRLRTALRKPEGVEVG